MCKPEEDNDSSPAEKSKIFERLHDYNQESFLHWSDKDVSLQPFELQNLQMHHVVADDRMSADPVPQSTNDVILRRMSSSVMTPMKNVPVEVNHDVSQRGTKRKVEFNLTPIDLRRRPKQRRKNPLEMPENISPTVFFDRYSSITEAITYEYGKMVLAWCPTSVVTGDFLATLVHKYGEVIDLRNRWLPEGSQDKKKVFGGMTIFYKEVENAISAANGLPLQSKYVKTILMKKIINDIATIEVGHPKYSRGTQVNIYSVCTIREDERKELERLLQQFGKVVRLSYKRNVCKVLYKNFTHAYLASIVLNEDELKHLGKVRATIQRCVKKDDILDLLKENVMLHVEDCFFTR